MKTFLLVLGLSAFASAISLPGYNRPEDKEENDISFFLWEDENGKYHLENLRVEPDDIKASASDITLYLYTKSNPTMPILIFCDDFASMISAAYYSKSKQNVFITHGWNNHYESPVNKLLVAALLAKHDVNVFVVDWKKIADKNYVSAKGAVPDLGAALGDFINSMISHFGITASKFNLIGHSLGAHISGCAGAKVNGKVNYIIGLDPASPLFTMGNTDNRLDPTDAAFVKIIHTNGLVLGFAKSIGHVDYYPNGGNRQPGCGLDAAGTCAHSRAYIYLAESITSSGFTSRQCSSNGDYEKGKCDSNPKSYMGQYNIDTSASGDHYLITNDEAPFSLS